MKEFIEKLKASIMSESYEDRAGRSVISVKSALEVIDRLAAEQPKEQPLDKIICFIKQKQEERALLGDFPELDRLRELLEYAERLAAEQEEKQWQQWGWK